MEENEETPKKLTRNELLARAREAKAKRAELRKQTQEVNDEVSTIIKEAESKPKKKNNLKLKRQLKLKKFH